MAVFLGNFLCKGEKIKSREDVFLFFFCAYSSPGWFGGLLVVSQEGVKSIKSPKTKKKKFPMYVFFVSYWSHFELTIPRPLGLFPE